MSPGVSDKQSPLLVIKTFIVLEQPRIIGRELAAQYFQ
jgi:hypothetical protein